MKNILNVINGRYDGIQDFVYDNCIIPVGTHLEIYCNPDGIYEEEDECSGTDGFSQFILVDKEITYYDLANADIYDGCIIKNDEVRIDIITEDDCYNRLNECQFSNLSTIL